MASSLSKVAKLEEQLEIARQDAAKEVATLALETRVYELGERQLKKIFLALAAASPEQIEAGIKALKAPAPVRPEAEGVAAAAE